MPKIGFKCFTYMLCLNTLHIKKPTCLMPSNSLSLFLHSDKKKGEKVSCFYQALMCATFFIQMHFSYLYILGIFMITMSMKGTSLWIHYEGKSFFVAT